MDTNDVNEEIDAMYGSDDDMPDIPIKPGAAAQPAQSVKTGPVPVKRGRGRPPKVQPDGTRPAENWRAQREGGHTFAGSGTTFPKPEQIKIPSNMAHKFFVYWKNLNEEQLPRATVKIYRKLPVIDRKLSNPKNTQVIEEINGPCPFSKEWKDEFLHRFGTGKYKILMNEAGVSGAILMTIFKTEWDLDNYPPRLDIRELVRDDPDNKSYIDGLRARGVRLPGDPDYKEEKKDEDDSVDIKAVESLTETVRDLTDKTIAMAERQSTRAQQQQTANNAPQANIEAESVTKAMDLVHRAGETAMGMIDKATAQITGATSKGADPIQMLTTVMGIVKEAIPKPDNTLANTVSELQTEMRNMQAQHFTQMLELIKEKQADNAVAVAPEQRKTFIEELREKAEEKRLMEELYGKKDDSDGGRRRRRDDDDEDDAEDKPEKGLLGFLNNTLPTILASGATILTMGANIWYNARAGQGAPVQPPPNTNPTQTPGNVVQMPQPQSNTPQLPPGSDAVGWKPNPADPNYGAHMFLAQIEPAFLAHFYGGETDGYSFAEFLLSGLTGGNETQDGRRAYMQIKEAGRDQLITTLQTYPPIWERVKATQMRLVKFIDEFLGYDELEDEQTPAQPQAAQQATQPRPVTRPKPQQPPPVTTQTPTPTAV